MYTLDANIFVRDANPNDLDHADCRELLDKLHDMGLRVILPTIVLAEVAGSLSRAYRDPIRARVYTERLIALPHITLLVVDETLGRVAANIAADYALRGMDAIYVAVAHEHACKLVTLDNEPRQRAAALITVQTPAQALAALSSTF